MNIFLHLCECFHYLKKLVILCDPPVDFVGPDFFLGVLRVALRIFDFDFDGDGEIVLSMIFCFLLRSSVLGVLCSLLMPFLSSVSKPLSSSGFGCGETDSFFGETSEPAMGPSSFFFALLKKLAILLLFSLLLTGTMKSGELFPTLPTSFATG